MDEAESKSVPVAPRLLTLDSPECQIGFGTYRIVEDCYNAVSNALKVGYRLIDTAEVYRNEEMVGKAIRDSGIPRNEIFLTSKMHPKHLKSGNAYEACTKSLERLGVDYLDLYLVHWPGAAKVPAKSHKNVDYRAATWKQMQQLYKDQKCRFIGVSNYEIVHLEALFKSSPSLEPVVTPHVNQFELHPMLPNTELVEYCRGKGIVVQAYSSLGQGESALLTNSEVLEIASKIGKSPAQVLLKWALLKQYLVIPKTVSLSRMIENRELLDWELPEQDVLRLDNLKGHRFCWDPTIIL
eukprot:TRINITY_DN78790_c0_g1_i1.p1 TRINITY_DN78790_c0_g1~~TRINITY_DN78790_c0_g1_i1.p1  ORF type:complete len:296 (-),score=79.27 TRINITY_DN78790_c0_g1_i1:42-929(-)